MPLLRYFTLVGAALVALMYASNSYFPSPIQPVPSNGTGVDKSRIRIHTAQKLPDKIVIDTSIPTIIPPSMVEDVPAAPVAVAVATEPAVEIMAMAPATAKQPVVQLEKRRIHRRVVARNVVRHQRFAVSAPPEAPWAFFGGTNF
jgi:hypothetical protein